MSRFSSSYERAAMGFALAATSLFALAISGAACEGGGVPSEEGTSEDSFSTGDAQEMSAAIRIMASPNGTAFKAMSDTGTVLAKASSPDQVFAEAMKRTGNISIGPGPTRFQRISRASR